MPKDLRNIETADVANRTIVPRRVGGALRTGKQDVPLNRAYQRFGQPKTMQQFANRYMNEGGTSPLFGKNPKITSGPLPPEPPVIVEGTFTGISDNGGTSIFLEGPTNKDSFQVGDIVTVKSDDNLYDITGEILVIGGSIIISTTFLGIAGPGVYSKEL